MTGVVLFVAGFVACLVALALLGRCIIRKIVG